MTPAELELLSADLDRAARVLVAHRTCYLPSELADAQASILRTWAVLVLQESLEAAGPPAAPAPVPGMAPKNGS